MNGTVLVNVVIVSCGAAVFFALSVLGARYLSEEHWLRKWAIAFMTHNGPLEMARLVGFVLLVIAAVVLSLFT